MYNANESGLSKCGVLCLEEMCGVAESGSCVLEGQSFAGENDDEAEFYGRLRTLETPRASICAHDITERDQAKIINIKKLLLNFEIKGATKQMRINDL
jgi:hypothetical protein